MELFEQVSQESHQGNDPEHKVRQSTRQFECMAKQSIYDVPFHQE
jgi:hypothetical protein